MPGVASSLRRERPISPNFLGESQTFCLTPDLRGPARLCALSDPSSCTLLHVRARSCLVSSPLLPLGPHERVFSCLMFASVQVGVSSRVRVRLPLPRDVFMTSHVDFYQHTGRSPPLERTSCEWTLLSGQRTLLEASEMTKAQQLRAARAETRGRLRSSMGELERMPAHKVGSDWERARTRARDYCRRTLARIADDLATCRPEPGDRVLGPDVLGDVLTIVDGQASVLSVLGTVAVVPLSSLRCQ